MSKEIPTAKAEGRLEKLPFETYIQMIQDSVGTNMFRHMWARRKPIGKKFDVLDDGYNSCAYYVSSILKIFDKVEGFHATVTSSIEDLAKSGWLVVEEPHPGDILVWEAREYDDGWHKHIGFYIGEGRAISNSWTEYVPVEHDLNFGEDQRAIEKIFHHPSW